MRKAIGRHRRVDVGADGGRAWALDVHVDFQPAADDPHGAVDERRSRVADGGARPEGVCGQTVTIRLIQRVLLGPEYAPGNAYWRNLELE